MLKFFFNLFCKTCKEETKHLERETVRESYQERKVVSDCTKCGDTNYHTTFRSRK